MTNIATDSAVRKPFICLPAEIFEHSYFDEGEPLSRREAVAWLAKHVRWRDNCTLRRGQGSWSLRYLAEAWGWSKDKVARFLKRLEKFTIIQVVGESASATAQLVITYLFSRGSEDLNSETATEPRQQCDSSATKTKKRKIEEDSPLPPEGGDDPFAPIPAEMRSRGAGTPQTEPPPPSPDGAGPSPNSAAPPSRAARACRMPDDWKPKPTTHAWALNGTIGATDAQIAEQFEAFSDHHLAKGSKFVDWDRAFQTWMRNAKRFGHLAGQPARKTAADWVHEKKEAEAPIW